MANDPSDLAWQEQRALIIGRAYPEPSKKHIETVCTGAITEEGEVLRLYPIPLRYLEDDHQYRLWSWVQFDMRKNPDDKRKESYRVKEDSIRILSYIQSPEERFSLLSKAVISDRETLEQMFHKDWTSIGVVEVELDRVKVQPGKSDWAEIKPYIKQERLDVKVKPLEQAPVGIRIWFRCKNNTDCRGHESGLIGWEYTEAFRKLRLKYQDQEAQERLKDVIEKRYKDPAKSLYALLGTHFRYSTWMVAELYVFDKNIEPMMF